jgi:hypothetical protein
MIGVFVRLFGLFVVSTSDPQICAPFRVCLDRAKNNVRIEELRIVSEDSEKIVIFRLERG